MDTNRCGLGNGFGLELLTGLFQDDGIYHELLGALKAEFPVLIVGETGVGKDILARWIHSNSYTTQRGEFIPINCATVPEGLMESELFGHSRGSFTGADVDKAGLIEAADGGTLFLDELEEMPTSMQAKLLRTLEEKEYRRIGETNTRKSNFRLICALNKDLNGLISEGKFRKDLYYRINVLTINIPPLRERLDKIPFFVKHFVREFTQSEVKVSVDAMERLVCYTWPGNVRELRNVIEYSIANLGGGGLIEVSHLPRDRFRDCVLGENINISLKRREKCFRGILMRQAMDLNDGDYRKVMSEYQVTKDMIYRAIRKDVNS